MLANFTLQLAELTKIRYYLLSKITSEILRGILLLLLICPIIQKSRITVYLRKVCPWQGLVKFSKFLNYANHVELRFPFRFSAISNIYFPYKMHITWHELCGHFDLTWYANLTTFSYVFHKKTDVFSICRKQKQIKTGVN